YVYLSKTKDKFCQAEAYNGLGANYYFLGNLSAAGVYFDKELDIEDGSDSIYVDALVDYYDEIVNNNKNAYTVVSNNNDSELLLQKAKDLFENDKPQDALKLLRKITKSDYNYEKALNEKVHCYCMLGDSKNATSTFDKLIPDNSYELDTLLDVINTLAQDINLPDISKYFKLLTDYSTDDVDLLNKKMNMLVAVGMYDRAIDVGLDILSAEPNNAHASYILGMIHLMRHEYEKSLPYLKRSYILTQNDVNLFYVRLADDCIAGKRKVPDKMRIGYEVPEDEAKRRLTVIKNMIQDDSLSYDVDDLVCIGRWAFIRNFGEIQPYIANLYINSGVEELKDTVLSLMIDPRISDESKMAIFSEMLNLGIEGEFPVVYSNYFTRLKVVLPKL
ncbi:MAG: tetratricopeptide repeat protein, partial [Clostridia bacterium]|nr:tetratricopeptide repeat protein [Clostridia bacterium]